jgi:hypothetical protein
MGSKQTTAFQIIFDQAEFEESTPQVGAAAVRVIATRAVNAVLGGGHALAGAFEVVEGIGVARWSFGRLGACWWWRPRAVGHFGAAKRDCCGGGGFFQVSAPIQGIIIGRQPRPAPATGVPRGAKYAPSSLAEKRTLNAGLSDSKIKARLADLGGTVLPGSPIDFGKHIAEETEKWGKVVKFANIKPE